MRCFAEQRGYDPEFWGIVGLLHDIDFEQWPEQHCVKAPELLREGGADESIIHAGCSHGWAIWVDIKPEHEMEKLLYAADELTGLIGAAALMRPSKSVQDMELSSLRKKFKDKKLPPAAPGRPSPREPNSWVGSSTTCWSAPSRP